MQTQAQTAEILKLVRFIKSHGHEAWIAEDAIGAIETFTKDGVTGQRRVILEKPSLQSVRDWLGY